MNPEKRHILHKALFVCGCFTLGVDHVCTLITMCLSVVEL